MNAPFVFEAPQAWLALPLLAAAAWGCFALERRRARQLEQALGPRASALTADGSGGARRVRVGLVAAGLLAIGMALLQPSWGQGEAADDGGPADLLLVLDVSRSMLARDLAPDRLRRAQEEIRDLAARARGDRLGLVIFAGEARLLVPLTEDADSFVRLLDLAQPGALPRGGTDLGAVIDVALRALGDASGEHEAIVLLTDGEDLAAAGRAAAARAQERGVAIHCVGFGSPRGAKIAVPGPAGETFLRDAAGREVVSALDAAGLRAIAEATGGLYLEAEESPLALARLHEERLAPIAGRARSGATARAPRFRWFLLAAFVCAGLELAWSERTRR